MAKRLHVGTRKGLFELARDSGSWEIVDVRFLGDPVSAVLADADGSVWAALDLGHVRARIQAADARTEASIATYEKTVLTSLEETENPLVEFGREQPRRDFLDESVQASQTAATLAHQRFENGATDFLTVLDAERVLLEAQNQLAQSQTRTATALIAVYKALGGGWEDEGKIPPP